MKFREGSAVRLRGDRFITAGSDDLRTLNGVLQRHPGVSAQRKFTRPEGELATEKTRIESASQRQQADKNLYFELDLVAGTNADGVLADLNALDIVELAYPAQLPNPLPATQTSNPPPNSFPPGTPNFTANQGYRLAAPGGVDADFAAGRAGGKGENVRIVDIEYGWNVDHEDLSKARSSGALIRNGTPCNPFPDDPDNHGTAVVGELVGDDNGFGVTGIIKDASLGLVNSASGPSAGECNVNIANAIDLAAAALSPGDVILIEQQASGPNGCNNGVAGCVAVEWEPAVYDAIVSATSAGVIVVEAAGNGAENLDNSELYGGPFPNGRADSGAIIVGAGAVAGCGSGAPARSRLGFSTHGARVDVQGWGECVTTTGYGDLHNNINRTYTSTFSGTSSASPIVASVAGILSSTAQGVGRTLTSQQVRTILRSTGTPQSEAGLGGRIGPLPDLSRALALAAGPSAIVDCGPLSGVLPRNDDSYTGFVELGFDVRFFGAGYTGLFVNNNGNVTFDAGSSTYSPFNLYETAHPIIAPFFSDIDTRSGSTLPVTYGQTTYGGRRAFCVNWSKVGEYSYGSVPNDIQLLLVDRSRAGDAVTQGDFDIIFNYDRILWDHGGARAGYSNGSAGGDPGSALELSGSGVGGAFLDSNLRSGLIHNRSGIPLDDPQRGRYVFPVRNGSAPPPGGIRGRVFSATGAVVAGVAVQACRVGGGCRPPTTTNGSGEYAINGLSAADYTVSANPPSASRLFPGQVGPVFVGTNPTPVTVDVTLQGEAPPPTGTTVEGGLGTTATGLPVLVVGRAFDVRRVGCDGGGGVVRVFQNGTQRQFRQDGATVTEGVMVENPAGTYTAHGLSLPFTGPAEVRVLITGCPEVFFNVYIDPSGFVRTTSGAPVVGATVRLLRADESTGPFVEVPDGSVVMSPSNTTNPDQTDAEGHFGWDVIAGFYKVRAEKVGCVSPSDPTQSFVETAVLEIPPPVFNIDLRLNCAADLVAQVIIFTSTPPADARVGGSYTVAATGGGSGNPVVFSTAGSSTPGACTVSPSGSVSFTAVGTCAIKADQAGGPGWLAAPTATQAFTISARVPQSLPGVVTGSTSWSLGGSLTAPVATAATFSYGVRPPALVPVAGDWDGDGIKTPGMFQGGVFKLRNANGGGDPDVSFTFGDPRGYPVAGDFDGDGLDDVAVFRAGTWQLRYSDDGATTSFVFGSGSWPTVVPVAGDWDGDGTDGIGIYTSATGTWSLRQTARAEAAAAGTFVFWMGSGSYPVVGDWDADGDDTVGVKNGSRWSLSNANDRLAPDIAFDFGTGNDLPVVWSR